MKRFIYFLLITIFLLLNIYAQSNRNLFNEFEHSNASSKNSLTTFALDIGNKWYYQRGTNTSECYAIIKEVTDTLSNGFREITCKNLFRTGVSITKEHWGFINGKFYSNSSPQIQNATILYNHFLTHDTCNYDNQCWKLIQYNLFNITDSAQTYSYWYGGIGYYTLKVITLKQVGIIGTWSESGTHTGYYYKDSTYLIGMYRNGEFLGDSIFYNPYRASNPLFPENNYYFEYPNVKFMWQIASEVISYRLQVSKDSLFNDVLVDSAGLTDTFLVIGPLNGPAKYYWRVGTLSSDGNEYWSSIFNFSLIVKENIVDTTTTTLSLYQNYPNPFYQTTKIKYSITTIGAESSTLIRWPVQIKVFNILGDEIVTLVNEEKPAGNYEVEFNGKELASGIYFYKLQSGSFMETKKFLLLK